MPAELLRPLPHRQQADTGDALRRDPDAVVLHDQRQPLPGLETHEAHPRGGMLDDISQRLVNDAVDGDFDRRRERRQRIRRDHGHGQA